MALARRDFRQANQHLKECLALWPDDPAVVLLAAEASRRQGDFDEATRLLAVYQELGGSWRSLELEQRLLRAQQGDLAEANGLLTAATDGHWWPSRR